MKCVSANDLLARPTLCRYCGHACGVRGSLRRLRSLLLARPRLLAPACRVVPAPRRRARAEHLRQHALRQPRRNGRSPHRPLRATQRVSPGNPLIERGECNAPAGKCARGARLRPLLWAAPAHRARRPRRQAAPPQPALGGAALPPWRRLLCLAPLASCKSRARAWRTPAPAPDAAPSPPFGTLRGRAGARERMH